MTTVTQWFSVDKNPCHVGIYQVQFNFENESNFRYWDGRQWLVKEGGICSLFGTWPTHGEKWRGLAEPAK